MAFKIHLIFGICNLSLNAMKIPFKYKDIHNCEAVVLTCIDFRFWRETLEFIEKELNLTSFDFPSLPGSAKAINECASEGDLAMSCVGVPVDLHHAKKVVIVNHEDCGAYGGSKKFGGDKNVEQKFHEEELRKAKEKILTVFPNVEVILIYARLVEQMDAIDFVGID